MAELEELASDALLTPKRVLPGQLQHQLPALGGKRRPAGTAPSGPPARSSRDSSEDEQLVAEDEEFEIAIGSGAAAEDEEVDQQAKEAVEEGLQHGRAE